MSEAFLDVLQNSLDRGAGAAGFVVSFRLECLPFVTQALQSEFRGDIQEAIEAGAQEGGADPGGITRVRIRPREAGVLGPESRLRESLYSAAPSF